MLPPAISPIRSNEQTANELPSCCCHHPPRPFHDLKSTAWQRCLSIILLTVAPFQSTQFCFSILLLRLLLRWICQFLTKYIGQCKVTSTPTETYLFRVIVAFEQDRITGMIGNKNPFVDLLDLIFASLASLKRLSSVELVHDLSRGRDVITRTLRGLSFNQYRSQSTSAYRSLTQLQHER